MFKLCSTQEIPESTAKGFSLNGKSLFVVHHNGEYFAYLNQCPHRGIALEWQPDQFLDIEKNFIQCATHGALFRIEDGECVAGPCPGETLTPLEIHVENEHIFLT